MVPNSERGIEKYACDSCKSSKVTCSRECSGCKRCKEKGTICSYSRTGVIRRKRQRKSGKTNSSHSNLEASIERTSAAAETENSDTGVQCHLADDIEATRQRLNSLDALEQHSSLDALSSLSKNCASTGIRLELDTGIKDFYLFEEYAVEWAEVFENFLRKGGPLMDTAPVDVIDHLRSSRPHEVRERAWLVMYYSIILNTVTSTSVKEKLRRNLWLALSDVRVLLEPSEANIHAMLLVLSQVSDFTGPSICWMLATNACRMLQALGVNQRHLDQQTRERRRRTFWHLNLLDKGLAIIFGRTPTFHREMVKDIGLPTLEQIQHFRPHATSTGAPGFFGAHFMYQKILLSHQMDDIWQCLYGEAKPNDHSIEAATKELASWYEQARKILEASALAEKPFCDAKNAKSIDIALRSIEFHFLYLNILLARSSTHMHEQCLETSKQMLHLLQNMAPESKEPYHPVIWQLVCCPFTPLLLLYGDIISNDKRNLEEKKEALAAMERLPSYLKAISPRNSLAESLESTAKVFVQHARSVLCRADSSRSDVGCSIIQNSSSLPKDSPHDSDRASDMNIFHSDVFGDYTASSMPTSMPLETAEFDIDFNNELAMFTASLDDDGMFDWLSWDSRLQ